MKRNQETQRHGERQHLKANTALSTQKKMNQKPYNQCLINLVSSFAVRGSISPSVFFAQKKLRHIIHAFPYGPRTRLISL